MADVAALAIDLHRGHLDPAVATLPLPAEAAARVVRSAEDFFAGCRQRGVPVIHVVTRYRDRGEILSNPAWRRRALDPNSTRRDMARHNIEGMPGLEIMPGLFRESDIRIDTKKRYDCFIGTELEFVLRTLGVRAVWVTGVNTNSCVLATAIAASVRDLDVTVVSDCVDSMDGTEFHEAGLALLGRAFAEVRGAREILQAYDVALRGEGA